MASTTSLITIFLIGLFIAITSGTPLVSDKVSEQNVAINPLIFGGVSVRPNEFPYVCSVEWVFLIQSQHICGATILSNMWLVTAGYCITNSPNTGRLEVLCGETNLASQNNPNQQRARIATGIVHPMYVGGFAPNDIGLLRLQTMLHFTEFVQPCTLPIQSSIPTGIANSIGWGGSESGLILQSLGVLQLNRIPIMPRLICELFFASRGQTIYASHFCTGHFTGGMTACSADIGSPLTQQNTNGDDVILGIVSLAQPCGEPGEAGTYTDVAQFSDWISLYVV